ncbi:MAG TPA: thiol peroxidase [Legionella sp.]|nr:thiol peroxidase [Legionella sp.]
MSTICLKDKEMAIYGELPNIGAQAPSFILSDEDLNLVILDDFKNQPLLINIYPSIDTTVCFESVVTFNQQLRDKKVAVICVSMDLPFAIKRIHQQGALEQVTILSDFRNRDFGNLYGVTIANGPLAGLLARAVIVLDAHHKVVYRELVKDISNPPNYKAAIASLHLT